MPVEPVLVRTVEQREQRDNQAPRPDLKFVVWADACHRLDWQLRSFPGEFLQGDPRWIAQQTHHVIISIFSHNVPLDPRAPVREMQIINKINIVI